MTEIVPSYSFPVAFFAFYGPPDMQSAVVARINAEVGRALAAPEVRANSRELDLVDMHTNAEQFQTVLRLAAAEYGAAVKSGRIQSQ